MKRLIIMMTFFSLIVITGFTLYGSGGYSLAAQNLGVDDCYSLPGPTIEAKVMGDLLKRRVADKILAAAGLQVD